MNIYVHLWQYLAEFFLEREMFETKVVQKIKIHILHSVTFFWKSCSLWDNVKKKHCRSTDDNIIRCMRFACWITKATDTHSEYVILIAFPRQKWFRERASILCLYVHCLSCLTFLGKLGLQIISLGRWIKYFPYSGSRWKFLKPTDIGYIYVNVLMLLWGQ
jgi:hypothetical protein